MAVRVVCPLCSTALSVKDEYAGRPVKCPKCDTVIPPAPPDAPTAPEPPAEATQAGQSDATPAAAPVGPPPARATARPVARSANPDDRPARGRNREDADDREDKDDRDRDRERPARPRRRGASRPPASNSTPVLLGVIAVLMLTCCGGVGFGVWWVYSRIERTNLWVNVAGYNGLRVGGTTRTQAEQSIGRGKVATTDDVQLAFPKGADPDRLALWTEKAEQGRAVIWRNGNDYLLVAFHPNVEGPARIQLKEWRPENGAIARDGEPDDAAFLAKYPPGKAVEPVGGPGGPVGPKSGDAKEEPPAGVLPQVSAVDLAQAFRDNEGAANGKYKDQWLFVEGKVLDVWPTPDPKTNADTVAVDLVGVKFPKTPQDFPVRCYVRIEETNSGLDLTRGQTVKLKGKCTSGGLRDTYVSLKHCRIDSKGADPSVSVAATAMIAEYLKDPAAANKKYSDKEVTITNARFESVSDTLAQFQKTTTKGGTIRIQVNFSFDQRAKLAQLRRGESVKFKANCGGLFPDPAGGDVIAGYRAYLVR